MGSRASLNRVLAVEVTARVRDIPQKVRLGPKEGMPRSCVASFDNLRAVPKAMLRERVGRLSPRRIAEVKRALGHALGWVELTLD
jgi:mRNA interferase MazF